MAIEKGNSPKTHQDQEISRILESSQETNDQVNTFPFSWLENQDKSRNDYQDKISCLDETLIYTDWTPLH